MEEGVATYGDLYDQIFTSVKELRSGHPTVMIVTNTIDGNIDPDDPDGLLGLVKGTDQVDAVRAWALAAYERWNGMLAERAAAAGFVLVDLFRSFNGPDGSEPPRSLTVDGTHPSQSGHDLIASRLADVDLGALTG